MGVRRRTYYSIDCNFCRNCLENEINNLHLKSTEREDAEDYATSKGWKKEGKDTWKCPACLRKNTISGEEDFFDILTLAKRHEFKKIMVRNRTWSKQDWCIINKLVISDDQSFAYAYGHTQYANGSTQNGYIESSSRNEWKLLKVLDEDITILKYAKRESDDRKN